VRHLSFVMLLILVGSTAFAQGPGRGRNRRQQPGDPAAQAQRVGEIHGMVRDEQGALLDGAQVTVNGFKIGAVSEHGHFHVTRVPAGEHKVTAFMTGYASITRTVDIIAGKTVELNLTLKATAFELNPLVVTGTRTIKKRLDSPVQVDVVPSENFDIESSVNVAEGIRNVPGVRVENNCQNCNFTQLRMNGLEGPYTQILVNGRATMSSLAGVYGLEQMPSAMVDRLEVVKGGGSSLYGGSAVGGVVNIITRKPQVQQTELGIRTGWVDGKPDNTLSLSSSVLSDDRKIGAFLFGQRRQRNPFDRNGDGYSEQGILKSNNFGGQFYYEPDEDHELSIEAHVLSEDRRGGDQITSTRPHEANIAEATETKRLGAGVNYAQKISPRADYTLYTSLAYTTRSSYYGAGQDPNAYGNTLNPLYMGGGQFNYRPNMDHALAMGMEFKSDAIEDKVLAYERVTDETYNSLGMFAQEDWQINPRFNAILGLRMDKHSEVDDPIFSPRASLLCKASEFMSLRGSFSTGYRPPVVFDEDLHITQVGGEGMIIRNSESLEEEKSFSFAGGLEYSRSYDGAGLFFTAGGFYTMLDDVFFVEFVGQEGSALLHERINSGGARVYGLEFEVTVAMQDRITLGTGWTFQKSLFDETQDISEDESVQILTDEFLRSPDIYGFVRAAVELVPGNVDLSMSLDITGPMHVLNAESNAYRHKTPWFGVLDTKVTFDVGHNGHIKYFVHAHNLFDSYQDDLDVGASRDAGYVYGPQRPRSFYTGISTGF
jgi:outer membrane receptor for ferrienterochelin and colicins